MLPSEAGSLPEPAFGPEETPDPEDGAASGAAAEGTGAAPEPAALDPAAPELAAPELAAPVGADGALLAEEGSAAGLTISSSERPVDTPRSGTWVLAAAPEAPTVLTGGLLMLNGGALTGWEASLGVVASFGVVFLRADRVAGLGLFVSTGFIEGSSLL